MHTKKCMSNRNIYEVLHETISADIFQIDILLHKVISIFILCNRSIFYCCHVTNVGNIDNLKTRTDRKKLRLFLNWGGHFGV